MLFHHKLLNERTAFVILGHLNMWMIIFDLLLYFGKGDYKVLK